LCAELVRALCAFLGIAGGRLDRLTHFARCRVDLGDALVLLFGCGRDGLRQFVEFASGGGDRLQFPGYLPCHGDTLLTGAHRLPDFFRGFLSRGGAAVGEVANLFSYHRKAQSRLSGASRFYRGVQSEYVGLKRNFIDQLVDLDHVGAGGLNLSHPFGHGLDMQRAVFRRAACLPGQFLQFPRMFQTPVGHASHLLE
jgi:hypothetical protein